MPASKPSARSRLKTALRIVVSVALLGLVFTRVDFREILPLIEKADVGWLAGMFAFMVGQNFLATYRWQVLAHASGADTGYGPLLRIVFASSFFGMFLPGGSIDVLRVVGLARSEGDLSLSFSTVLVDRLFGVFALAVLVICGTGMLGRESSEIAPWAWAGLGLLVVGGAFLLHPASRAVAGMVLSPRWLAPLREKAQRMFACFERLKQRPLLLAWSLVLAFAIQFVRIATILLGARAFGIGVHASYFVAIVPIVTFLQLLPVSVGGLGVREAALVHFLGLAGVDAERALLVSIFSYVGTTLAALPGAWFGLQAFSRRSKMLEATHANVTEAGAHEP